MAAPGLSHPAQRVSKIMRPSKSWGTSWFESISEQGKRAVRRRAGVTATTSSPQPQGFATPVASTLRFVPDSARPAFIPRDRPGERIARCLFGLVLFGIGITLLVRSELGAAPWDVFHTGVSELTGISTGWVIVITGLLLLLLWVPLHERPGLGTILNATVIGIVFDLTSPIIGDHDLLLVRGAMMVGGIVVVAIGSGFYIGAGLGPGPRDGLMTGLARQTVAGRSISIRTGRTFVELVVLVIGVVLGGAIGIGTLAFMFGIGPLVQVFLPRLTMSGTRAPRPATV